ncbi:MAG: hypothetical protein QNK37_30420 [Acidobacteriota bacterium]|nr:hypothetical protein [Acidobacteriota bacterium]
MKPIYSAGRKSITGTLVTALFLLGAMAWSQDPAAIAVDISKAQKQNARALTQYSWKNRVEVRKDGKSKSTKLYQMRFDLDGKLQKTQIGGPDAQSSKRKQRGVRGRIKEKKKEKAKDFGEELVKLVTAYTRPSTGKLVDFFEKGSFASGSDNTVKISTGNYIKQGDRATMWVDKADKQMRKLEFTSVLDGKKVSGKVDYRTISGGPTYSARSTVTLPEKNLEVIVENFDYIKQ